MVQDFAWLILTEAAKLSQCVIGKLRTRSASFRHHEYNAQQHEKNGLFIHVVNFPFYTITCPQ